MTNVDIVNDIDCLRLFQHSSGSERYLRVATGDTAWMIGSTIDGSGGWITSASAGVGCPASAANKKSDRFQLKSWRYHDGKAFVEGDIRVTCITHT